MRIELDYDNEAAMKREAAYLKTRFPNLSYARLVNEVMRLYYNSPQRVYLHLAMKERAK